MGAAVEVNTSDFEKLARKMNSFMLSGGDTRSLLDSLGLDLEEQTKQRIKFTKLNPDGKKWDPWKESTDRYMKKHFPSATLLTRDSSAGLLNSIEFQVNGNDSVIVGSSKEYAGFLREGTRKMVAREFLGIGTDDIDELQDKVIRFMERHLS